MSASRKEGSPPVPEEIIIIPASEGGMNAFRDNWSSIPAVNVFAGKACQGKSKWRQPVGRCYRR
jgi:hypothetical protein